MVMMNNKNKIILIGPPESGKTTITEVFFRNENPLKLINTSLDPTRGINSNLYSIFNSQLGIHDLAGQENAYWFSSGRSVFINADLIVCLFDVTSSVENITQFLMKVVNLRLKMEELSETQMFILLHKIDLVNSAYLSKKKRIIKDFFKSTHQKGRKIRIFGTSIKKQYFYHTYQIMLGLLRIFFEQQEIKIEQSEFENLKTEMKLILNQKILDNLKLKEILSVLKITEEELKFHLERLERLNFVHYGSQNETIQFTQTSNYFKKGLQNAILSKGQIEQTRGFELLYTFLSLTEQSMG